MLSDSCVNNGETKKRARNDQNLQQINEWRQSEFTLTNNKTSILFKPLEAEVLSC